MRSPSLVNAGLPVDVPNANLETPLVKAVVFMRLDIALRSPMHSVLAIWSLRECCCITTDCWENHIHWTTSIARYALLPDLLNLNLCLAKRVGDPPWTEQ